MYMHPASMHECILFLPPFLWFCPYSLSPETPKQWAWGQPPPLLEPLLAMAFLVLPCPHQDPPDPVPCLPSSFPSLTPIQLEMGYTGAGPLSTGSGGLGGWNASTLHIFCDSKGHATPGSPFHKESHLTCSRAHGCVVCTFWQEGIEEMGNGSKSSWRGNRR